jgi:indolepyruvate ferredoxin oxidoreductase
VVANLHVTLPGSFARERDLFVPRDDMLRTLEAAAGGAARVHKCDFRALAAALAGDAVYANLLCLGFAYQKALIPVPEWAIHKVIQDNYPPHEAQGNALAFEWHQILKSPDYSGFT